MQDRDRDGEKHERERTLELESELFPQNPRMRRNRLADSTYQLFEYHMRLGNIKVAGETISMLVKLAEGTVGSDPQSSQFLQATANLLRAKSLYQSGEREGALNEAKRCLDSLKQIEGQLRPREYTWISLAHSVEGWSLLQLGKWRAALEDFEAAAQERLPLDPLRRQRVTRDKRLAQFFALDFSTAAKDFLLHADDMQEVDSVLWNYFIEKRNDPGYEIKVVGPQSSDQFDKILIGVNSGAVPKSALIAASKLAEERSDAEGRCKRHFFVGESWLLLKR
jgi:tetratricopeptide (TPR) repeat protein